MDLDLTNMLAEWPYQPGQLTARMVLGLDGRPKVQVRLDLGILQFEADGRPDGQRPFGYLSLLEYYEDQVEQGPAEQGDASPGGVAGPPPQGAGGGKARLSPEDCRLLREEAAQYYHRYLALLVLEEFDRVIRDTTRNLRVLDLCAKHGETEEDRTTLEQFRAYIVMVRARAQASQALKDELPKAAIFALDEALDALRRYYADLGRPQAFEQSNEVQMLQGMKDALTPKLPISQQAELRTRLQRALEQENYELAAILRDELKQVRE